MSWKPEVLVAGDKTWYSNAIRFPSEREAEQYVKDLAYRWTSVRESRVIEVDEPSTARWINGQTVYDEEVN